MLRGRACTTKCANYSVRTYSTSPTSPGCRADARCSRSSPKTTSASSAGTWPRPPQTVADNWVDGTQVDLDTECRRLTLRALGRSVLGLDLDDHSDAIAEPLRVTTKYVADRALQPLRAPRWLPTPARRRARAASDTLHRLADEILQACRADPTRGAPLAQALIAASDPATGRALSDDEIRDELVAFMFAGHDTTATTLTYALWALGHHPDMQDKVRAEVDRDRRSRADTRRRSRPRIHRSGAARGAAAVPTARRSPEGQPCATSRSTDTVSRPAPCWT